MMGGRNVQHVRFFEGFHRYALCVQPGAESGDTAGGVDLADFAVARLLHGVALVPAQKLDQKIVKKVRARADKDVLRVYLHPPKVRQMGGNGLPQFRDAPVGQGQQ